MEVLYMYLFFFASAPLLIRSNKPDPCSDKVYREIPNLSKRNPSYLMDSAPLCDYHFSLGWYRGRYSKMPTSAPSLAHCGTLYPFWLNGTHPPVNNMSTLDACKVGFASACVDKVKINVKNCSSYIVYKLPPVDSCNSAYCFEPSAECVTDVPHDPTVSYHSVSWENTTKGVLTKYEPSINLKCGFTPLNNNSLFYEISWYVDNIEIVKGQTVASDSLDKAQLSAYQMLSHNKKAGSMIHCVVGAKYKENGFACKVKSSPLFFAGIKVLTPQLSITRGGTANVQLQFTIPYVAENVQMGNMELPVSDLVINLATLNATSVSCNDGNNKLCGIKVKGYSFKERHSYSTDIWKQIHNVTIFNRDDFDFTGFDKHILLRLETVGTEGNGSRIFSHITLPDIQVYIYEPTAVWKGKYCGSFTDPHMVSFDGYRYECQENGMYILYRNSKFDQEVQVKHHKCYPSYSYPRCTCAVAARSGRDVFTLDICSRQKLINFPFCKDKVLKVITNNDKNYQVIFPTGTWVDLSIIFWPTSTTWQINVKIYPSPSDVEKSRGLCGILDGKQSNDLTRRNGIVDSPNNFNYHKHPVDFSHSWRILDNENLFTDSQTVYDSLNSISNTLTRVCTCKEIKEVKDGELKTTTKIECSYGTYKDCKFKIGKQFHCLLNPAGSKRRRRDLTQLKNMMEAVSEDTIGEERLVRDKRQAYDIRTEDEAHKICINAFEGSQAFTTCQQYVTDLSNATIDNCISDVMMTGDDNITKIHIEAALEQCSTLVLFNTTFQIEQPEITYKVESLCPNNCSGNGDCNGGNCTCNTNFAGSDCSFDLLGPPKINHISDFGLCDKSYEECEEITLYGELFLEHMNTECYITRRTIKRDGSLISESHFQSSLEPRTLFEGYCPLLYGIEPYWVTEFIFNISNDGIRFTDNYNVYTYQSDCQELQNVTGNINFVLKSGYCFIDGKCYADGDTNRGNLCDLCNVTLDKYSWSFNAGHCLINGKCYENGAINGTNPCSTCLSSVDTSNWSDNPGYCYIDDICYFDGQSKENNDCYRCNYTLDRTLWTFAEGYCLIDGQCFHSGQSHTTNRCKVCDPNRSRINWTLSAGYCLVNDSCLKDGESEKTNPCLMCNVSASNYTLFPNPGYCMIGGQCFQAGKKHTTNQCKVCDPHQSKSNWTLSSGYCFVNNSCIQDGKMDKTNPCLKCIISNSTYSLSPNPGHCMIDGQCFQEGHSKDIEVCQICDPRKDIFNWTLSAAYCYVGGLCVAEGQTNDTNNCSYCNTSLSRDNWSFSPGHCMIDGKCFQVGQKHANQRCKICDPIQSRSQWTLNNGYCLINESCLKDGEFDYVNRCLMCNSSASMYSLSPNPECFTTLGITTRSESTMWSETNIYSTTEKQPGTIAKESSTTVSVKPRTTTRTEDTSTTAVSISKLDFTSTTNENYTTKVVPTSTPIKQITTARSGTKQASTTEPTTKSKATTMSNQHITGPSTSNSAKTTWSVTQSTLSLCFESQVSGSLNISLKNDFCFINDTCIPESRKNPDNVCEICNPQHERFGWTLYYDCQSTTTTKMITDSGNLSPIFIAIVSSVVAVFLIIITVSVICWRRMKRRKYWSLENEPLHQDVLELSVKKDKIDE